MNVNDLINCANAAENLRKALHKKNKMSKHDCKEYRLGILRVLCAFGFMTYEDESLDITNCAGAWDDELREGGEWIIRNNRDLEIIRECPNCHSKTYFTYNPGMYCRKPSYCEDCGRKMKGGE